MLERDWAFLKEARAVLEDYLLSPELYWPLGAAPGDRSGLAMLQFTLGNLELSLRRLAAANWTPAEQAALAEHQAQIESVHNRWQANWAKKAEREYESRFKQWANYLQELVGEQGKRSGGYAHQVRARVILDLLEQDIPPSEIASQTASLAGLDRLLRGISSPGSFLWEPEVEPGFPSPRYWYLYVTIKEK